MSAQIALNVDCMEYMRTLPDKAFDLAIVDPPYGIGEDGGKSRSGFVTQKNGNRLYVEDGHYEKTGFDIAPPRQAFFDELFRVSKAQIIWGANYFTLPRAGAIVWDKCNDGSDQSDGEIAFNSLTSRVDIFRYMWRGMMQGEKHLRWNDPAGQQGAERKADPSYAETCGAVRVATDEVRQRRLAYTGHAPRQWEQQDSGLQPRL